jgi:hypothetical protein
LALVVLAVSVLPAQMVKTVFFQASPALVAVVVVTLEQITRALVARVVALVLLASVVVNWAGLELPGRALTAGLLRLLLVLVLVTVAVVVRQRMDKTVSHPAINTAMVVMVSRLQ